MFMQKEVQAGMDFLDEKLPGWRSRIDLETLDLSRDDRCVVGQLMGSFSYGGMVLGLRDSFSARRYGFIRVAREHTEASYGMLTETWKFEIERTRTEHLDDERRDREQRLAKIRKVMSRPDPYMSSPMDLYLDELHLHSSRRSSALLNEEVVVNAERLAQYAAVIAEMQVPASMLAVDELVQSVPEPATSETGERERELVLV